MICSRTVFRCFKALERLGDRITGAAGPYFVAFAVALIGLGTQLTNVHSRRDHALPALTFALGPALRAHRGEPPPRAPGTGLLWAAKKPPRTATGRGVAEAVVVARAAVTKCRRCGQQKPERTHHCRICNRCVLKYDHHCPCAGESVRRPAQRAALRALHGVVLACASLVATGVPHALVALGAGDFYEVPLPIAFVLIYILAAVMALAVGIMCAFHLWGAAHDETTVEGHGFEVYRRVARGRGEVFVNSYDLGKRRNLELFFNVGEGG
ncbi:DHHC palmitoyltransferase-domain-containing protein [Mycena latifolia]|nr:DHHC palmitoyltransferase-domain-containing protein [Mycena latifolia]